MESLRDIKRKIAAVKKTKQITRAMNMVAASKLRGAQDAMERFKPYARKFAEVLSSLAGRVDPDIHPLLITPEEVRSVALIVIASDRGLCGSYNTNLTTAAEKWARARRNEGKQVSLYCIGRKSRDYFRRRDFTIARAVVDHMGKYDYPVAQELGEGIIGAFLADEYQEVYELHAEFINVGIQRPVMNQLLPVSPMVMKAAEASGEERSAGATSPGEMEYLFEPSAEALMIELLPKNIEIQLFGALLEAVASEHAARMTAMDNAQSNCSDMIQTLTLAFNKARQSAITAELMDIVGGAEALKS